MKRVCLITSLVCTITCIIALSVLLVLAIINENKYDVKDSLVFIESVGDSIKEGMGFVYKNEENKNYIITNYHVIEGSDSIYVYNLDKKRKKASIIDYDSYTDIAILKINDTLNLEKIKIGNSSVKKNDSVYYYNINKNIIDTSTILSLNNEIILNLEYGNSYYDAISIKGDISNGNSGGPILNGLHEVIGLVSLKEDSTDIGYYIPIGHVMNVVTKLENHTLVRPNLGAIFISYNNVEALSQYGIIPGDIAGVVVAEVTEQYPLNMAGLIKGDIITKINNIEIANVDKLQKEIYSYNINDSVNIEYFRNGIYNNVDVLLDK